MVLYISALSAGVVFDAEANRRYSLCRFPCMAFLSAVAYVVMTSTLHDPMLVVKGILFAQLLFWAGYVDVLTHEIPNEISVLILLTGMIQVRPLSAVIGFFAVSLPMLIIGMIVKNGVGGGDIKLMASSGVVLGPLGVMAGTVISCAVLVLYQVLRIVQKKTIKRMNAMAPYFAIGCLIAFVLENKR